MTDVSNDILEAMKRCQICEMRGELDVHRESIVRVGLRALVTGVVIGAQGATVGSNVLAGEPLASDVFDGPLQAIAGLLSSCCAECKPFADHEFDRMCRSIKKTAADYVRFDVRPAVDLEGNLRVEFATQKKKDLQ